MKTPVSAGMRWMLALLAGFLVSCQSMELSREARKAGAQRISRDSMPVVGTFEGVAKEKIGPREVRLWEVSVWKKWNHAMTRARGDASQPGDQVRITHPSPQLLEFSLVRNGKVQNTARLPFTMRRNHVLLHQSSDFGLLPFGYHRGNSDIAIAAGRDGDLVLLYRYESYGVIMMFGGAGTHGRKAFRFRRAGE